MKTYRNVYADHSIGIPWTHRSNADRAAEAAGENDSVHGKRIYVIIVDDETGEEHWEPVG